MDQLAEYSWSHFCYSPLITRGSAVRVQLVKLLLLTTHHPWVSWQSTAGRTSVTLHSPPVDQLAEHSWSHLDLHFCYSPLITRGSTGRAQLVTLLSLSTHHPWISWQSTAGHTSVTLHSSPVDQLAEYSWSHFCYSPLITRGSAGKHIWSHFCYSPLITRGSPGRAQLVTLLLLSTHHPWISWQSTAGHTSVTLHSSPVDQLAEHSWSHFYYSPLITRGSVGRAQLVTLLLLSTHHPWISWQSTAGHTSVTLHLSPVDQLAEYSWSHFYYSPLITRGSAGRTQLVTLLLLSSHHPGISWQSTLVTLLLLSTYHPWISWQSTAVHTSVTLQSSSVDQLAEHSWSHFYYSPLITRGSAGRTQLVTLLLLSTHHPCVSWQSTMVTLLLLSTHHPWISWQSTAVHTSVTLQSSSVDQLAKHSWSHFYYSPLITRGSAGRTQLVTLLLLSTYHPWISWQNTAGHTSVTLHSSPVCQLAEHTGHTSVTLHSSHVCQLVENTGDTPVTLHSSPVDQLAEHSWSHFCYSPLITCGSAGTVQLVTLRLISTHHPWISWQSTAGHTSVTLHSSPVDQLPEYSWSHICHSPLITRGSAGRAQLVSLLLLSTHNPWISWHSTAGHTSVTLHSSPVDQLAEYSWSHFYFSPLITRGSAGRILLVILLLLSSHNPWTSWQSTAGQTSFTLHSSAVDQLVEYSWSHFCFSPLITRGSPGRVQLVTLLLLSTHHPWISWHSTAAHTSLTLH